MALSAMTVVGKNYSEHIEHRLMRDRWKKRHRSHHDRNVQLFQSSP